MDENTLSALDHHFSQFSFIKGYTISASDFDQYKNLIGNNLNNYCYLKRWYNHISTYSSKESLNFCANFIPKSNFFLKETKKLAENIKKDVNECNLPQFLLNYLQEYENFNTYDLAQFLDIDHQRIIGAIRSLLVHDDLIETNEYILKKMGLSTEGKEIMENGSHEANVYYLLGEKGEFQDKILEHPFGKIGIAKALSAGWIGIDKSSGSVRIVRKIDKIEDMVKKNLILIANNREEEVNQKFIQELKKRKLVIETNIKTYFVRKGSSFTIFLTKQEMDLTADMITSESWRMKTFKTYNFNAYGLLPNSGHLHPLMKVHYEFRQIFFQMGFSEMPTNRYIESSFWNFDALFQPQQHPARDVHDTFFLSDPATSDQFPEDYVQRVKEIHEKGGYGSKGYNYEWKIEEAQKNILRTHTTAVSAKQLYLLAQQGFKPVKLFSIDRVFRNETLDATHLAEFHQVEGVIAERDLSLAHVMGLFTEFFRKCGITNLRFKPTYNPYTEPSMEIFAFHVGLNKWVEIGNSGMFRPEMLLPMGFPADVSVAGYGLSLERPTMIRYGIDNIRDLFGPKVDLEMVYRNPMCRLDKK